MMEQLSLWSERPQEESARPEQKTSLHEEIEQKVQAVMTWAHQHGWWELCYVQYDGSLSRIGPGKEAWDAFAQRKDVSEVLRASLVARSWEIVETRPGIVAGEFVVEVPSDLRFVDLVWGRKRLLELGEQCEYWPIHWCIDGKVHQALQLGRPCWEHQAMMATTEWLTTAIAAVERYMELKKTSIRCASCNKPLYFPGLTVEHVHERFKDACCSLCGMPMIAKERQS
jgi:hypothetical protein